MPRLSILVFLLFLLFLPGYAKAQNGFIRGTVYDAKTGETLPGVTIFIVGSTTGTLTDFDGKFNLSIAPGEYNLRVSYISYETVVVEKLLVKAGGVVLLDNIQMREARVELSEVTITAEAIRNSEAAMLTMKQKSANLIDGISAANFRKIGDSDAASSLKRVTGISVEGGKYVFVRGLGDRYTKTILNGIDIPGLDPDRNTLQMDIFPTNIIDNIIVHKSFSAELPADFTGGVIDIATKDFPEVKTANLSLSLGYNPDMHFNNEFLGYEGGKTDWLGYDDGTRAIPATDNIPFFSEVVGNPDGDKAIRFREIMSRFNPLMGAKREQSLMDYAAGIALGNQYPMKKVTLGYNVSFSYKYNTEYYENAEYGNYGMIADPGIFGLERREYTRGAYGSNSVLLGGLAGVALKTKNSRFILNFLHLQNGESKAAIFDYSGSDQGSNFDAVQHNLEYSQRALTNILLSGKHFFSNNKWGVEWKISPTKSALYDPDVRFTRYETRGNTFSISTEVGFPERIWRELTESNFAGQLSITRDYKVFGRDAVLKFGGSYTGKNRDYEIRSFAINVRSVTLTGDPDELFYPENIWPYNGSVNRGTTYESRFVPNNPNQYNSNNENAAFYVSTEFSPLHKLKAIIGLRGESFVQRYTGQDQTLTNVLDNEEVISEFDFFPAANIIYSLTERQNLRVSYSQTIARPSFKEMSYAEIFDPITGRVFVGGMFRDADDVAGIEYWDGNLKVTRIRNADLRWELFQGKGQTLSISAFYKFFDSPIEIVQYLSQKGAFQPRNVGDGQVGGFEFEMRQGLGVLSSRAENIVFSTNITYTHSRIMLSETELRSGKENARTGETVEKYREMAGQAPYIINAGLSFDGSDKGFFKGFEAGLFYNVQGPTLEVVGIADRPDVYSKSFNSLNLNINKTFGESKKLQLGLKVDNILGDVKESVFRSFEAEDQFYTYLNQGRTFQLRLGYRFF
ncbi:TonB dependent receptor [anaerobic digester metagenome]